MISTIIRGLIGFISGSGIVFLNVRLTEVISLSPIMTFISWVLASLVSIITFLWLRRQWIKLGLEIEEKRKNKKELKS